MAKPKDKDRRAVLEQLKKEQRRAEKRRTSIIITSSAVVALAIIAVPAYQVIRQEQAAAGDLDTLGQPADGAGCDDVVTEAAEGNNDHRPQGEQLTYERTPPAYGPHYDTTAGVARRFFSVADRPEVEYLVHNLEHGYTILWYDETIAEDADQLAAVRAISTKFEGNEPSDKFIAAPWTAEDGDPFPEGKHVALTHWSVGDGEEQVGVWQYCGAPSGEVVAQFVEDYPYSDSPEPAAM